jgi:hypothetical protein
MPELMSGHPFSGLHVFEFSRMMPAEASLRLSAAVAQAGIVAGKIVMIASCTPARFLLEQDRASKKQSRAIQPTEGRYVKST